MKTSKPLNYSKKYKGEQCSQGKKFQESVPEGTPLACDTAPKTPGASPPPHGTNLRAQTAPWRCERRRRHGRQRHCRKRGRLSEPAAAADRKEACLSPYVRKGTTVAFHRSRN